MLGFKKRSQPIVEQPKPVQEVKPQLAPVKPVEIEEMQETPVQAYQEEQESVEETTLTEEMVISYLSSHEERLKVIESALFRVKGAL